jgi:hypothetical protein
MACWQVPARTPTLGLHAIHFRAEPPTANPDKYADELLDAYISVEDPDALYAEYDRGLRWRIPWILPRSQTLEAKLVLVIGERAGNVGGEELRYDLTDHGSSVR